MLFVDDVPISKNQIAPPPASSIPPIASDLRKRLEFSPPEIRPQFPPPKSTPPSREMVPRNNFNVSIPVFQPPKDPPTLSAIAEDEKMTNLVAGLRKKKDGTIDGRTKAGQQAKEQGRLGYLNVFAKLPKDSRVGLA